MARRRLLVGAWVPHSLEMLRSPARRHLPDKARRVLDRLEVEHMEHGGFENGALVCTYSDFAASGIRRHKIAQAVSQCVELGFLKVTVGRRAIAQHRTPSRYRLTYVAVCKTGAPSRRSRRINGDGSRPMMMRERHWLLRPTRAGNPRRKRRVRWPPNSRERGSLLMAHG